MKDAFSLLMNTNSRKRPRKSLESSSSISRFEACPICQKSISLPLLSIHVDSCGGPTLTAQEEEEKEGRNDIAMTPNSAKESKSTSSPIESKNISTNKSNSATNPLLWQQMMESSKKQSQKLQQWFHLNAQGQVQWFFHTTSSTTSTIAKENNDHSLRKQDIQWSASVTIHCNSVDAGSNKQDLLLHITSSMPPPTNTSTADKKVAVPPPTPDNHRFSVPILKSMLQKNIRRRRPLPAMKIAMAMPLGELLRRLPIICLEDSTLHPDFAFCVWCMTAHSKEYAFSSMQVERIYRIVYEVASCPLQDNLWSEELPEAKEMDRLPSLCLTCMSPCQMEKKEEEEDALLLRAILVRHKYGGMACDMKLLQRCAKIWKRRFGHDDTNKEMVNPTLVQALVAAAGTDGIKTTKTDDDNVVTWSQVPSLLHSDKMKQKSKDAIQRHRMMPYLQYSDLAPAGIDFHCCSKVFELPELYQQEMQDSIHKIWGKRDGSSIQTREQMKALLKRACWECSAGVNYRRGFRQILLLDTDSEQQQQNEEEATKLEAIWKLATPIIQPFVQRYLRTRFIQVPQEINS
eukprot:scaffold1051_cov119-Cylindrotheca_fusiformis.AAC.10